MLTKLLERIKENWLNGKWFIYGAISASLIYYLLELL